VNEVGIEMLISLPDDLQVLVLESILDEIKEGNESQKSVKVSKILHCIMKMLTNYSIKTTEKTLRTSLEVDEKKREVTKNLAEEIVQQLKKG